MSALAARIALTRPLNCLITAISVAVGVQTGAGFLAPWPVALAALSAALITGAGNAVNDVVDIDIDRINRPNRPLPSGRLDRRQAILESLFLAILGLALAGLLSPLHLLIASGVSVGLLIYSIYLKNSILWGNILIGAIAACAFPYGALAVGPVGRSWIPASFALLFHLGREIVKDIEDVEGDRNARLRTLPLAWGRRKSTIVVVVIYLFLIGFMLFPWISGIYSLPYLSIVLLLDLLLLHTLYRLLRCRARLADGSLGGRLKAGMLLGLLAILAGELWR